MAADQVFVMTTGTLTTQTFATPNLITAGTISVVKPDNVPVLALQTAETSNTVAFAAAQTLLKGFRIIQRDSSGFIRQTRLIDPTRTKVYKRAYVAPVKHRVTLSALSTTAGTRIEVRINPKSQVYESGPWAYTSEVTVAASETGAALAARIVALINARTGSLVTASVVATSNVQIESTTNGYSFEVTGLNSGTKTIIAGTNGSGTGAEVALEEQLARSRYGELYVGNPLLGAPATAPALLADASLNYLIYNVMCETEYVSSINKARRYEQVMIALATGVTNTLDTFFGTLIQ